MKTEQLKKVLKPLIKQCVKEVIFEDGTLSTIISEVMKGTSGHTLVVSESNTKSEQFSSQSHAEMAEQKRKQLLEQKRKMLDAIGKDAYNGVDLFEGTTPTTQSRENPMTPQGSRPLDGTAPNDPGVDLSGFGMKSQIWKKLAGN